MFSSCLSFTRTLVGFRANPLAKTPFPNKIKFTGSRGHTYIFLVATIQPTPSSKNPFLQLIWPGYHLLVVHLAFFPILCAYGCHTSLPLLFMNIEIPSFSPAFSVGPCPLQVKGTSFPLETHLLLMMSFICPDGVPFLCLWWDYLSPDTMWDWRLELVFWLPRIPYSAKNASRDSGNICE